MRSSDIASLLPHRSPMLFLDGIEDDTGSNLKSYQTIHSDHPSLRGHFPGFPVWPGTLLLEAMAQTAALLFIRLRGSLSKDEVPILGAVECRFLMPVFPGNKISYEAKLVKQLGENALFFVTASRDERVVARANIAAGIRKASAYRQTKGGIADLNLENPLS